MRTGEKVRTKKIEEGEKEGADKSNMKEREQKSKWEERSSRGDPNRAGGRAE